MMYVYTYRGYIVAMYPYTPFYEICDFVECGYFFVMDKYPEKGANAYSLQKGFETLDVEPSDLVRNEINRIREILVIHYGLLGFENSVKMRYIPRSYGYDAYVRMLEGEIADPNTVPELFTQLAISKGSTVEAEMEEFKLKQFDIKLVFKHMIALRYSVIDSIKANDFVGAIAKIEKAKQTLRIGT